MKQILYPAADAACACGGFAEKILRLFNLKPKPTATCKYQDIDMVTFLVGCEQGWNGVIRHLLLRKGVPELNSDFRVSPLPGEEREWHLPLELAVRARSPKCAVQLRACGADPKAKCRICGRTPLKYADPVMRVALGAQIDPNVHKIFISLDGLERYSWRKCMEYEALRKIGNKALEARISPWRKYPAVYYHLESSCMEELKTLLYPLLLGDYSDEEISWVLELIHPRSRPHCLPRI